MNLFVYEHITSGALIAEPLTGSLAAEGDVMLHAIVQDLVDLQQFAITIMRDIRLAPLTDNPNIHYDWIKNPADFAQRWQQHLAEQDLFFIIAPETDALLARLQQQVTNAGKSYLGSRHHATVTSSNKLDCYHHLKRSAISTPTTCSAGQWLNKTDIEATAVIIKPLDGAGCLNTFVFNDDFSARQYLSPLEPAILDSLIVQPYIVGQPASLSLFITTDNIKLLSINLQQISQTDQQLQLTHCVTADLSQINFTVQAAADLAQAVKVAIPGLWGFVGIDLVLTAAGAVLIEINPRLTVSYSHLRSTNAINPCRYLVDHLDQRMALR